MEISAQSIQTVGGQSGPLQSLVAGLKPGDALSAQILARTPSGTALVALAGKQVHMPLPQNLLPGTLLTLTVQQGSSGMQFLVQPQGGASSTATASQPSVTSAPTTSTGSYPSTATSNANAPSGTTTTPQAAGVARTIAPNLPTGSGSAPLAPLVNARTGLPVPAPQNTSPGQVLTGQVLSAPTSSTAIIAVGKLELPVSLPQPAAPGTQLPLVVQSGPQGLQLAHAPPGTPLPAGTSTQPGMLTPAAQTGAPAAQPTPLATPAAAASPAAVLSQATIASLGNQNSVAALLSNVLRIGDRARELPEDVQRAAQRLTQLLLPLDGKPVDVAALQRSVMRSGVFLESQLAQGATNSAVDGDLKALLLVFRRTLGDWLGTDARQTAMPGKTPAAPQPGTAPRAPAPQSANGAPLPADVSLEEFGKTLLSQTDAALARVRLHQLASLPDRADPAQAGRQAIHLEVPVGIGQQAAMLSLVITRDGDNKDAENQQQNWKVQFSVNADVMGEVGAEVGLLAGRTNVVLSAVESDTADALSESISELTEALEAVGLTPGILRVRKPGAPAPTPSQSGQPVSGHLLDRDT